MNSVTALNSIESQHLLVTVVSSKALREDNYSKSLLRLMTEHCLKTVLKALRASLLSVEQSFLV